MAAVFYSPRALRDLQRLAEFLENESLRAARETVPLILEAIEILARHPLVGRIVEGGLRELVISRGRSGYVALYRFDAENDSVYILALRHQRELGFD
jgi:addiction module RelE/StbE family toxin